MVSVMPPKGSLLILFFRGERKSSCLLVEHTTSISFKSLVVLRSDEPGVSTEVISGFAVCAGLLSEDVEPIFFQVI